MKEFVIYTVARLGLFVASYAVIAGVYLLVSGDRSIPLIWPFLAAVVVSSVASVFLLKAQRHRFAMVVERRASAATRRIEQAKAREDDPED